MKYLLLIHYDEAEAEAASASQRVETYARYERFNETLRERGIEWSANPLHATQTATIVRVRDGERSFTDGPFAEAREQLGGFYLVDVADHAEAIELAALLPGSSYGAIEVRRVLSLAEDPKLEKPVED